MANEAETQNQQGELRRRLPATHTHTHARGFLVSFELVFRTVGVLVFILLLFLVAVQDGSVRVRVAGLTVSRPVGDEGHLGVLRLHAEALRLFRLTLG